MSKNLKRVEKILPDLIDANRMLKILELMEKEVLPELLSSRDPEMWESLYIDYEKPFVERLWYQFGPIRINLHKIHPCKESEALFHPHPWPSAMHVLSGTYETAVGSSIWSEEPRIALRGIVNGGFKYEMLYANAWHYVRPIGGPAYTLMITGKPWKNAKSWAKIFGERDRRQSLPAMRQLTLEEKANNLLFFWNYYIGNPCRVAHGIIS